MSPEQAQSLLRQEVAANSPLGQALLVVLHDVEIAAYRATMKTADPYAMAIQVGRGQGIQSILKRVSPTQEDAPTGPPAAL